MSVYNTHTGNTEETEWNESANGNSTLCHMHTFYRFFQSLLSLMLLLVVVVVDNDKFLRISCKWLTLNVSAIVAGDTIQTPRLPL